MRLSKPRKFVFFFMSSLTSVVCILDRSSLQQYRWPQWHAVFQRPGPEEGLSGLSRKVQLIARFKPYIKLMEGARAASSWHSHPPSCGQAGVKTELTVQKFP